MRKILSKAGKKWASWFDCKTNNLELGFVEKYEIEETCAFDLAMAMCPESELVNSI